MSNTPIARAAALTRVIGQSGRRYVVERLLQDRPGNHGRVYLATSEDRKYVLKTVPEKTYKHCKTMFDTLRGTPHVRVAEDTDSEHCTFIHPYRRDHLLSFVQKDVPLSTTKLVLRDALRGLVALHAKGMVHTDIKPNNILLDWNDQGGELEVKEVQIADMEDMVRLPDNHYISGRQWGNWMWRSPEAHAAAAIQKPTDMFSFGLVCIYAVTKEAVLAVDPKKATEDNPIEAIVVRRQVSYFSDLEDMEGLITYLEDSPWIGYLNFVMANFSEDYPRRPLCLWSDLDEDLKDLLMKMMSMDPKRRITASEALAHKWFADVP